MKSDNKILELSFDFALSIIELYKKLNSSKEFIISKQLLKSGTSIGANIEEAIAAQSRKDFISKMSIASKEARETRYWLRLLKQSKLVDLEFDAYITSVEHIINILTKIVKTSSETVLK
ncbi:MAG: four helix bundle protein [Chitinophagaceae bacterium]|nr:four helix bundle protein [Flavisolibacter sp.]MDQ3536562.1 four helix bundle protein [Bacteroidota bacterium]